MHDHAHSPNSTELGSLDGSGSRRDQTDQAVSALRDDFFERSPIATALISADATIADLNPRWCSTTGWDRAHAQGKRFPTFLAHGDEPVFADSCAALSRGDGPVMVSLGLVAADGAIVKVDCLLARSDAASGGLVLMLGAARRDERRTAISIDREALLNRILDNTVAMIGILETDGTVIEANMPALTIANLSRSDVIGKKFWDCYWWAHDPNEAERLRDAVAAASAGQIQRYDAVVRIGDDSRITIDFMLSPVLDDDGQVCMLIPSGFDISDRKRSEQRLAYAMREVNHRSKNLLTVVQSMLRQMRPADLPDFIESFGQRLRALSACQDLLVRSNTDDLPLKDLILSQFAPFESVVPSRIRVEGDDQQVNAELVQSLGMAFYELVTNASKYGALSNTTGEIDISWTTTIAPETGEPTFCLTWQERNGPQVQEPRRRGFGSVVLNDMLSLALNGSSHIDFAPSGLRFTLKLPSSALSGPTEILR